jgi:hypothetical protein
MYAVRITVKQKFAIPPVVGRMANAKLLLFFCCKGKTGDNHEPIKVLRILYRSFNLSWRSLSYGVPSFFICPDPDAPFQIGNKYLSVADPAGFRALDDGIDRGIDEIVIYGNLKSDFLKQVDLAGNAPIGFSVSSLLTAPERIGNGHLSNFRIGQRLLYIFKFFRLNICNNELHE